MYCMKSFLAGYHVALIYANSKSIIFVHNYKLWNGIKYLPRFTDVMSWFQYARFCPGYFHVKIPHHRWAMKPYLTLLTHHPISHPPELVSLNDIAVWPQEEVIKDRLKVGNDSIFIDCPRIVEACHMVNVIANDQGSHITPSWVSFTDEEWL